MFQEDTNQRKKSLLNEFGLSSVSPMINMRIIIKIKKKLFHNVFVKFKNAVQNLTKFYLVLIILIVSGTQVNNNNNISNLAIIKLLLANS